jgi:protein ImuB
MQRSKAKGRLKNAGAARTIQEIVAVLHKWGIHTLGQVATLDKEELRSRLGVEAVRFWERATGQATRLLKLVQPPESFDESFEFDHEIETVEPLLFMLRRFLEQLALRLGAIYLVARELTLRITFSNSRQVRYQTYSSDWRDESAGADKQIYERVFKIPQPTNDVDLLFRMLQTHLENFKSKHAIVAVALSAEPIRPAFQQFGLFETMLRNPTQLYETLARLTALLGSDRVGTPIKEETHRPDAFRMEPFGWRQNGEIRMSNDEGSPKCESRHRTALRQFRPAAAASIFISDNRHLQSEKVRGKVVDQRGPFLLSGNWWNEKSWARAEWDMQLEDNALVRCHEAEGTWRVDGIYD